MSDTTNGSLPQGMPLNPGNLVPSLHLPIPHGNTDTSAEEIAALEEELYGEMQVAEPAPKATDFYRNLAEIIDPDEAADLVRRYCRLFEIDKEARRRRDEMQRDALRATGLQGDTSVPASSGDMFEDGSITTHPGFMKATILYGSQMSAEMLPPDGPCKGKIIGDVSEGKTEKSDRKVDHINWQLTEGAPEFYSVMDEIFASCPVAGDSFLKLWWDPVRNGPRFEAIKASRVHIPFSTSYFYAATRITVEQRLSEQEINSRMESGMYVQLDLSPAGVYEAEDSQAITTLDRQTGRSEPFENADGERLVLWISMLEEIETVHQKGRVPYLMEIDLATKQLLCLYRNFEEEDVNQERFHWLIRFPFLPWQDAYSLSLFSCVESLSVSATGALRGLLDSAHVNNTPSLIKLKGMGDSGENIRIEVCNVSEIDGGVNAQKIQDLVMAVPFNPPSPVLFNLLGFLSQELDGVVRMTLDDTAIDTNANTPVGTQLSRVEQGLKVFKAIHNRNHRAFAMMLRQIHRLNRIHLDERMLVEMAGERLAMRSDYVGPIDVIPVSDPEIFSDQQRIAQSQALASRAESLAPLGVYNVRAVEERFLKAMRIPNYEELLNKDKEISFQNAVNENMMMIMGRAVMAYPEQDHLAHLETHVAFFQSPVFGGVPGIAIKMAQPLLDHVVQHVAMWYVSATYKLASNAAGMPADLLIDKKNPDVLRKFDKMLASASYQIIDLAPQVFSGLPPVIQRVQSILQQQQQQAMANIPQPQLQAAMAETRRKSQADQTDAQLRSRELDLKEQGMQGDQQAARAEAIAGAQQAQDETATETQLSREQRLSELAQAKDQQTLEHAKLASSERIANQDNQTRLAIARMQQIQKAHESAVAEQQANADRMSGERQAAADRFSADRKADADRFSDERMSGADRVSKERQAVADRAVSIQQSDADRASSEREGDASRASNERAAKEKARAQRLKGNK